jgi:hypothetical protein
MGRVMRIPPFVFWFIFQFFPFHQRASDFRPLVTEGGVPLVQSLGTEGADLEILFCEMHVRILDMIGKVSSPTSPDQFLHDQKVSPVKLPAQLFQFLRRHPGILPFPGVILLHARHLLLEAIAFCPIISPEAV